MVLTQEELQGLVELRTRSPHQLLGMHPLGDGSGVVVRAMLPGAARVQIEPVLEKDKPAAELQPLHKAGIFEAIIHDSAGVYAYDLVITDDKGNSRRTRDAYSF